jgi:hypothetical protein
MDLREFPISWVEHSTILEAPQCDFFEEFVIIENIEKST